MDAQQRQRFADPVREARGERNWNQSELAEAAGVGINTVGAIEAARNVQTSKVAAVRESLGIPGLAEVRDESGLPHDVELARDAVTTMLLGMPREDRAQAVVRIWAAIASTPDTTQKV